MLSPRESAGCAVYLGHLYMAGGKDELKLELHAAAKISLLVFNGALLAVGGSDGFTHLKTTEVYSHENNTWRHFGSIKSKHPGGRVAALC
ncbi:YLP motif-containing protein 1 [Sarotherodon galilaeus]